MVNNSPVAVAHRSSMLSILWGVLLIIFGMMAIGSPMLAAVAVNVVIAWLIVLAGIVHIVLAFHRQRAGSVIWKLLVGVAYLFFGGYLLLHPVLGVTSLTLALAALFVIEGILNLVLFFKMRPLHGSTWVLLDGAYHDPAGPVDLYAMAIEFSLGHRNSGGHQHDLQRRCPDRDVAGIAQGNHGDADAAGSLELFNFLKITSRRLMLLRP